MKDEKNRARPPAGFILHTSTFILTQLCLRSRLIWTICRTLGLLTVLLIAGCSSSPPSPPSRDTFENHWKAIAAPGDALAITYAVTNTVTLAWYQPGNCAGWKVFESTDLKTWHTVATLTNTGGGDRAVTNTVTTTNNPAFYRVAAW